MHNTTYCNYYYNVVFGNYTHMLSLHAMPEILQFILATTGECLKISPAKRYFYYTRKLTNNETGSRSPCMRPRSDPPKMKNSMPDKIVAEKKIRKKNNEANWMVSNSAKLDCRTKQHTQFGVSASNGSRDMAWTKSWQKKIK